MNEMFGVSGFTFRTWLRHMTVTHTQCGATKIFESKATVPSEISVVFDWITDHKCEGVKCPPTTQSALF
jgi:hypothetical protein